jgi:alpha/beta hydrolase family protein
VVILINVIASAVLVLALFIRSQSLNGEGSQRTMRHHLLDSAKGWGLLALFYVVSLMIARKFGSALISIEGVEEGKSLSPYEFAKSRYAFHTFAMLVCTGTNFYLRRALAHIEAPQGATDLKKSSPRALDKALSIAGEVRDKITEEGILITGSLSALPLIYYWFFGKPYESVLVICCYLINQTVSTALLLRVGSTYLCSGGGWFLTLTCWLYGLLQFPFSLVSPGAGRNNYLFALGMGKLILCYQILSSTPRFLARLDAGSKGLDALGNELFHLAKVRALLQGLAIVFLATIIVIPSALLVLVGFKAAQLGRIELYEFLLGLLFLILVDLALFQTGGYLIFRSMGYAVNWDRHSRSSLRNDLSFVMSPKKWLSWDYSLLESKRDFSNTTPQYDVILVHGIYGSGPTTWGLLPAILLCDDKATVRRVHLLSYKHTLWTRSHRLEGIDFKVVLRDIVADTPRQVVILCHSLGGLLVMKALSQLDKDEALLSRLDHVCLIGVPFGGSLYAVLGFPWSWPKRLRPGSRFVKTIVHDFADRFPPPGQIVGEAKQLPSFSIVTGSRDRIAASQVFLYAFPRVETPVIAWHTGIAAVFQRSDARTAIYLNTLRCKSRALQLMELCGANLVGSRKSHVAATFSLQPGQSVSCAVVEDRITGKWGQPLDAAEALARNRVSEPLPVFLRGEYLRSKDSADLEGSALLDEWDNLWGKVEFAHRRAQDRSELLRLDWDERNTLYMMESGRAGFVIVVPETLKELRSSSSTRADEVLLAYIDQLGYAIAASEAARSHGERAAIRMVVKEILKTTCVVALQCTPAGRNQEINANYMIAHPRSGAPAPVMERMRFAFGDASRYDHVLSLEDYASDSGREWFSLPVEGKRGAGWETRILPGAPEAFAYNRTGIVDDTKQILLRDGLDGAIKDELERYFATKDFRSFASLNLTWTGRQVGILNIESTTPYLFGRTDKERRDCAKIFYPLCLLLGSLIAPLSEHTR